MNFPKNRWKIIQFDSNGFFFSPVLDQEKCIPLTLRYTWIGGGTKGDLEKGRNGRINRWLVPFFRISQYLEKRWKRLNGFVFKRNGTFFAARDGKWRSSPSARNPLATGATFSLRRKSWDSVHRFHPNTEKTFSFKEGIQGRNNAPLILSLSFSLSESRKFLSRLVTIFFLRLKTWNLNSLINKSKRNSFGDHRVHSLIRDKEIEASLDRKSNRPFPFY